MSSVFDFLFQGSPPPSVTSSTSTQQGFPDWYQELMRANIGQGIAATSQPYQPFPGQQQAGFTAPTQQAFQMTQQNVGSYQPSLNSASGALTQVAQGFNPQAFQQYMNPYMSNVVDTIQQLGNRNLMENVLPGINDTFTSAGQFGSTRNADITARAVRDNQQSISNAQGQALMSGTQNAMANYLQGQQNQNIAGQQLGTLGQIFQNSGLKDAASLNAIGQQQQGQTQSGLDIAYQNYQNQLAYPYNQVNFLNSIIRGFPAPTQSIGTAISPQNQYQGSNPTSNPSALGSGLATGGGLAALLNSNVASTPILPGGSY